MEVSHRANDGASHQGMIEDMGILRTIPQHDDCEWM